MRIPRHDKALRYPLNRNAPRYSSRLQGSCLLQGRHRTSVETFVAVLMNETSSFWRIVVEMPSESSSETVEDARKLADWFLNSVGDGEVRFSRNGPQLIADRDTTEDEDQEARRWRKINQSARKPKKQR